MVRTSFKSTSPSNLDSGAGRDTAAAAPPHVPDLTLLAAVGAELADPIATMQYVLQEFSRRRTVSDSHLKLLHGAVDAARKVAMQTQQIARVTNGKLKHAHERLKLDQLLHAALREHARDFQTRGVELHHAIRPVEVIVDPGLLTSLLDASIEWALSVGQKLLVTLDMKNWPEHGVLFFKASQSVAHSSGPAQRLDSDSLSWHLLHQIAQTIGVSVDRVKSNSEAILMLEFPRTVRQIEGLTAVEVETGFDSFHGESRALAGHRILVITDDEKLRFDIRLVARDMSLEVDFVQGTAQAVRFCELDLPHMIIIDERIRDSVFNELRNDLLKTNPNFPFLEISIESNTFEIAGWMTDSMARVSRDSLRAQLPAILALELARIM